MAVRPVSFTLDDGERLTFTAHDLCRVCEALWQIAHRPGAVSLAALVYGARLSGLIRAPVDLSASQSAALREALARLQA